MQTSKIGSWQIIVSHEDASRTCQMHNADVGEFESVIWQNI